MPLQRGWSLADLKELRPLQRDKAPPPRLQCHTIFSTLPTTASAAAQGASGEGGDGALPALSDGDGALPPSYAMAAACFAAMGRATVRLSSKRMDEVDGHGGEAGEAVVEGRGEGSAGDGANGEALLVCTTALNVARFTGRYVRIMQVVPSLAADALHGLRGLYELYLYVLFCVFWTGPAPGSPGFDDADAGAPPAVRKAVRALHVAVKGEVAPADDGADLAAEVRRTASSISFERLRAPLEAQPMCALPQAIASMESLRHLAELVETLRPTLAAALAEVGGEAARMSGAQLSAFVAETVGQAGPVASAIYRGMSRNLLNLDQVTSTIRNRSWTPREAGSQHSAYVDHLLGLIQQLAASLSSLQPAPPKHVACSVVEEAVAHITHVLLDDFCAVKKMNDEGRATMSRDVKVLQAALDNLQRRGALPSQKVSLAHVDAFVQALHLPSEQVLAWAQQHQDYSMKHLSALVLTLGAGAGTLKKPDQQKLIASLQALAVQPRDLT